MCNSRVLLAVTVAVAALVSQAHGQTARPLPDAAALFDTAVVHLVELELQVIRARAQGLAAPHPDVRVPLEQIAALRELLAGHPDTAALSAAVEDHLERALHARLASVLVAQRLLTIRRDPAQPELYVLQKEEALLRLRLGDLSATPPE